MGTETSNVELTERLKLIESMMIEGRRTTESYGWTFVLWGLAYYVAILWASLGKTSQIWMPGTLVAIGRHGPAISRGASGFRSNIS